MRAVLLLTFSLALIACTTPSAAPTPTPSPAPLPTLTTEAEPTEITLPETFRYYVFFGSTPHRNWDRQVFSSWAEENLQIDRLRSSHDFYSGVVPTTQIVRAMESDPAYDVIAGTVGGVFREYAQAGLIADISDLWEQNGWFERYPQSIIDMASVDGKQYFVPLAQQWNPVWYRSDIFEAEGLTPPESWEDLLGLCESLAKSGYIPITVSVRNWNAPTSRWFTMLNARLNGLEFHHELIAGRVPWTDARVEAVFLKWRELFEHRCFAEEVHETTYGEATSQLGEGEAAMYLLGEWISESYPEGLPESFDFFPVPVIDPELPRIQLAHVFGAFMPAAAEHPEHARALLTHFGSVEVHTDGWQVMGRAATNLGVDQSLYPEIYRRGVEFVSEADALLPLFEVSMRSSTMTRHAFAAFASFYRDPSDISGLLERLEEIRLQEYGA